MSERPDRKAMRLRYAGGCRLCAVEVAQGVSAVYERQTRSVLCLPCAELTPDPATVVGAGVDSGEAARAVGAPTAVEQAATLPGDAEVSYTQGVAGLSARREFDPRPVARGPSPVARNPAASPTGPSPAARGPGNSGHSARQGWSVVPRFSV